ncbi:MAG TPA: hypothetical protein VKT52_13555 [Ktedonobacterales bacterium]|nr:hypothetical protein [Ktedonobacterales bacterium]
MAGLVAVWVGIGLVVGLLAHPARLWPVAWGRRSWLWLVGLGVAGALAGALLGTLLFSLLIATAAALLVAVVIAVAVPWALAHRASSPAA